MVVTALGENAELWMNRSEGAGHWLDIALEGTKSNRDGIGARIKVVTSAGAQYNHMTTSVGYASSSYGPVHFGLGKDARRSWWKFVGRRESCRRCRMWRATGCSA